MLFADLLYKPLVSPNFFYFCGTFDTHPPRLTPAEIPHRPAVDQPGTDAAREQAQPPRVQKNLRKI